MPVQPIPCRNTLSNFSFLPYLYVKQVVRNPIHLRHCPGTRHADVHAATSLPMAEWIQQHFFPQDSVDGVHMYLRKWAHFIVYFKESGLLVLAMKNVMKAWKAACAVFGLCTILAIADEAHKVLIVGRHCQWDEAGINIVGVIMGVLLTWSILWLIRWARGTLED